MENLDYEGLYVDQNGNRYFKNQEGNILYAHQYENGSYEITGSSYGDNLELEYEAINRMRITASLFGINIL